VIRQKQTGRLRHGWKQATCQIPAGAEGGEKSCCLPPLRSAAPPGSCAFLAWLTCRPAQSPGATVQDPRSDAFCGRQADHSDQSDGDFPHALVSVALASVGLVSVALASVAGGERGG